MYCTYQAPYQYNHTCDPLSNPAILAHDPTKHTAFSGHLRVCRLSSPLGQALTHTLTQLNPTFHVTVYLTIWQAQYGIKGILTTNPLSDELSEQYCLAVIQSTSEESLYVIPVQTTPHYGKMASKTSAVSDEPIEVLFALHPKFNLVDLAGPLEALTYAQHDPKDECKLQTQSLRHCDRIPLAE
jgi:hypothetical protein